MGSERKPRTMGKEHLTPLGGRVGTGSLRERYPVCIKEEESVVPTAWPRGCWQRRQNDSNLFFHPPSLKGVVFTLERAEQRVCVTRELQPNRGKEIVMTRPL